MLPKVPPTGTDGLLVVMVLNWFNVLFLTTGVFGCSYAIKKKDEIERVAKANR